MSIHYLLHSGKNPKWLYLLRCYLRRIVPGCIWRMQREGLMRRAQQREDWDYMQERIGYYCRLSQVQPLPAGTADITEACKAGKPVYRHDTYRYVRWFDPSLKMRMIPGDVTEVPDSPALLKSRPIDREGDSNRNSVLLKLNAVRHFIFVDDKIPFEQKKDIAVFRGKVKDKPLRQRFFRTMFGQPFVDLGDTSHHTTDPQEWQQGKMTIPEHLNYKFILTLEGNDVASNLKWVMSSNSIAITPRMVYETWFMEGRLIPNYHYIEIRDDFSDLQEKIEYYSTHLDEANAIIQHAHEYVQQFRDNEREELLGLLVCDRYFKMTNSK